MRGPTTLRGSLGSTHHLQRLTLNVRVGDMGEALVLRDRVDRLAEGLFAQVVERTLQDLAPADLSVTLDKVELDLGVLAPDRLETDAPAAFERLLREALTGALGKAGASGLDARTVEEAALDDFELFLVRGAAPFGVAGGAPPREVLRMLIAAHPSGLAQMLRRRAGARYVLERLALLADDPAFADLIAVLAPADARVILAYLVEMGRLYPASPLAKPVLTRVLRVLTLDYLLNDPGGAFNRRRYAEAIVRGLAEEHGLAYRALLTLLLSAVPGVQRRRPVAGSLLEVLTGLAEEAGDDPGEPAPAPADDIVERAAGGDLEPLLAALRHAASRPMALDRLMRRIDHRLFARLVAALDSAHADIIVAYAEGLIEAHQTQPILPLSEGAFELRLRRIALRFLLDDAGSSFNRRAWLRRLLMGLARESGVGYADLLSALTAVIKALRSQTPPRGQLPLALSALAADLPRMRADARSADHRLGSREAGPADRLAAIEQFLRTGAPSAAGPDLAVISAQHPTAFAALLRRLTRAASNEPAALVERLLAWMAPEAVADVLWVRRSGDAERWADDLVETEGLDMASAWTRVLAAGLRGEAVAQPAPTPTISRTVRDALLRHWLDHGVMAWWAPPGVTEDMLWGDLVGRPAAALCALFADPEPERVIARLQRATALQGGDRQALLRALAPWAFTRSGPSVALGAGASDAQREAFQLRAAAAAVNGEAMDLTAMAQAAAVRAPPSPPAPEPPSTAPCGEAALLAWLRGEGRTDSARAAAALGQRLATAGRRDSRLDTALRRSVAHTEMRSRLASALPHAHLALLARRLAPGLARLLDDLISVLVLASTDRERARRTLWAAALAMLAAPPSPRALADRLIAVIAPAAAAGDALRASAEAIARRHGHAHLKALLAPARSASADRSRPRDPPPPPEAGETHFVANAGLVIFNPFLPRLFESLGVLSADEEGVRRITGVEAASRAVHLLQYLVDGRVDAPEPELLLNKLLCGLTPATPIEPEIELSDADRSLCDSLLTAVINAWTIIANTSAAGLRETFLQREGRLRRDETHWSLTVQRKTLDVLTDQIPWSLAVVYHPWMPDPVHVTW